ncbi:hypothetical protein [Acidisoma sp. L85]|jgi:hypothetical protein|uniref:hypothetical protein n=1 Tax=Acidisoma sp. L85 TaxID=1641850 RepID=UPI00131B474A|nr:hypothetical protein [Acidisoma sp. L85]
MRADLLHVIATIANPIRWKSRDRLYDSFEQHMLDSGVRLTVVECAYGERPFRLAGRTGVTHIGVRARTPLWCKERLINLALARLPDDWKYVAWIDADIRFRKAEWAVETVHALQQYDVVQPWSDCYDLGPNDDHLQAHRSFCRLWHEGRPIIPSGSAGYQFAHPGYAWAATRQALDWTGGLIDTAILGAGDHHMALALINRVTESVPSGISASYLRMLLAWQTRARHIAGNISYVPGTIEHLWHGPKDKRAYVDRWGILTTNAYDPDHDIKRNVWGVWELAGNKPALTRAIDRYLRSRDEDSNSMG